MIERYTRESMGRIWSTGNKYRQWLEVELAASEVLAELGEVPGEAAQALRRHADFEVRRIEEIETEVKHDVIAFTTAVAEKLAAARSTRNVDTALPAPCAGIGDAKGSDGSIIKTFPQSKVSGFGMSPFEVFQKKIVSEVKFQNP